MGNINRVRLRKFVGVVIAVWLIQLFGVIQPMVVGAAVSFTVVTSFLFREGMISGAKGKPNYRLLSLGSASAVLLYMSGPYVLASLCILGPCDSYIHTAQESNLLFDYAATFVNWTGEW